jgi:uncharacterized protein (DUF1778 family)
MPEVAEAKSERLQVRLDARAKTVLQRAASYSHQTVSQFVLNTALEQAERVIRQHEVITLSDPDWAAFYDALTSPPAPNAALRKAFERHGNLTD